MPDAPLNTVIFANLLLPPPDYCLEQSAPLALITPLLTLTQTKNPFQNNEQIS